jgi:hypothetical protein
MSARKILVPWREGFCSPSNYFRARSAFFVPFSNQLFRSSQSSGCHMENQFRLTDPIGELVFRTEA